MAPRLARLVVAHTPHHIVQRGHSRQAIFAEPEDYQSYLSDLREKTMELGVQVHAYCLMTNHVHLMLTPSEETKAIGRVMQETGRRATRRWNQRCRRSGTLWESRYKSSVVQTETYLLACCRYIELNPVRARMVARAEDYPWSSYRSRMGISDLGVLALHPVYQAMGASDSDRRAAYRSYVESAVAAEELERIRHAAQSGNPLATEEYCSDLEAALQRQVSSRGRGRPAKMQSDSGVSRGEAALKRSRPDSSMQTQHDDSL